MAFNSNDNDEMLAEINVTPLVDVMLVLLVIFMISAPLMLNGINVKLPKTKKISGAEVKSAPIILSVGQTGEFFLDDQKVLSSELISLLVKMMEERKTESVFVRADFRVPYGKVAEAMAYLKGSGITHVSLITEVDEE